MTLQEEHDLNILKEEIKAEKIRCFDAQVAFIRMLPENLVHTGHKDTASAVLWTVNNTKKTIKRLTDSYLKKYPD